MERKEGRREGGWEDLKEGGKGDKGDLIGRRKIGRKERKELRMIRKGRKDKEDG